MVLYIIGLGLGDPEDITYKGLKAIKGCQKVYLEYYTSLLCVEPNHLENFLDCKIELADREQVEDHGDQIIKESKTQNVAFLVVGDPFAATTHSDLYVRALKNNVTVNVIHNASIMTAIAICGLQLYNFGQTIRKLIPNSYYYKLKENKEMGLHTLCLLDIRIKERTEENIILDRKIYEPPSFMNINTAIDQLLAIENDLKLNVINNNTYCIGLSRIGHSTQKVVYGTCSELLNVNFGPPLHSLIIPGTMHIMEQEVLEYFKFTKS